MMYGRSAVLSASEGRPTVCMTSSGTDPPTVTRPALVTPPLYAMSTALQVHNVVVRSALFSGPIFLPESNPVPCDHQNGLSAYL